MANDDDPVCTDCGGTGITYQTERRCACQPAAHVNETPKTEHDAGNVLTPGPDAAAIREAALMTVPDEIELYYIIKASGAKKRIDVARAVSAHLEPMRRAILALITEGTIRKSKTVADDWECPIGAEGCHKNCGSYGCGN